MNTKLIVAAVLVIGVGAGAVVVVGDVLPGGNEEAASEPFPTETPTDEETATGGTDGGEATATSTSTATATQTRPFGFTIDNIEKCGQTCRDVTSTLTNQQDTTAENVTVYTRIFAGKGTDGEEVWRGTAEAGTLAPGESYTATRRVELSYSEAFAVQNNDGWITVQTTVKTANQTVTFTDQRQVL